MAVVPPVLIELPESFQTARLLLRAPRPGDGAAIFEALAESLTEMRRFLASLPWVAGEQSVDVSEAWARNAASNFLGRRDLPLLMFEKHSGQLLGATGLHRMDWNVPRAEIGYWCRTSRVGHGFVTEAVEGVVGYAFDHLKALRLEIVTDEANIASRRIADRCGFVQEALLRHERRAPDGTLRNTCIYARYA